MTCELRIIFSHAHASSISKTLSREGANGYAALTATILTLVVSLLVVSGFALFALREVRANRIFMQGLEAHAAAESGLEDAVYRLVSGKQIASGETFTIGGNSIVISVTENGTERIVRSEGAQSNFQINQEARLIVGPGASFVYGAHGGNGGVLLENTSKIIGSIYAGGDIEVRNSAEITGDAFAAGLSRMFGAPTVGGNAHAHRIENANITGDARANTNITGSAIGGNAFADVISGSAVSGDASYFTSLSGTSVGGSTFPGISPPSDLPPVPFSISDSQIAEWENAAQVGGVYTGSCPYQLNGGVTILGPLKIGCDFIIQSDAEVILSGPLWIAGNLSMKNNAVLRLAASYGTASEVVIADNPLDRENSSKIQVENNAQVLGSGTPGSYILVVSQNSSAEQGGSEVAVEPKNNSQASVYYAPHGEILIQNSSTLKEITAYKLHLKNSATLTYESGLTTIHFSFGPGGGFDVRSWQEVQ